jgi:hypothetical protein
MAGKRFADGVKEGLFSMMEDLKVVTGNDTLKSTPRQRGESLTRTPRENIGLGIVAERPEGSLNYSKRSSPMKRSVRRESDGDETDVTNDALSTDTGYGPLCISD